MAGEPRRVEERGSQDGPAPRRVRPRPDAGWGLDPVPDQPGASATRALLTPMTCQDLFRSPDRSVGFGHLESTRTT